MRMILCLIGGLWLLGMTPHPLQADVYTWLDGDGNLHITQQPPPQGAKLIDITRSPEPQTEPVDTGRAESPMDLKTVEKIQAFEAARERAEQAVKDAEKARREAFEAVQNLNEVTQKRVVSKASREELRAAQETSQAAQENARAAEKKANEALAEAKKLQKEIKSIEAAGE